MYYSSGNYEAFAHPKKPEGVDHKSAYNIGSGLAALTAACYLVRELAAEGAIDGIEVDHPSNSPEDSAECLALCKQYGLVATAGTDFHGRNHKHPHPIGTCTAPDEAAAQLRAIAEKRKRERT